MSASSSRGTRMRGDDEWEDIDVALREATLRLSDMPILEDIDPEGLDADVPPAAAQPVRAPSTELSISTQEALDSGIILAPRPGQTESESESEEDYGNSDDEDQLMNPALSITLDQAPDAIDEVTTPDQALDTIVEVTAQDVSMLQQIALQYPRALPPPAAITAAPMPEDVPAVNLIILQGDQVFHHQRSRHQRYQEEPPTHFHDDESDDEDFEGEVDAGSTFGPHVATIGPVDRGAVVESLAFGPILEAPVPRHEKPAAVKKDGEDNDNAQCLADHSSPNLRE